MEASYDEIFEAEMSKKMRKRLKRSFNDALEAHDQALKSEAAVAKYNSGILRDLEAAFAANSKVDLLKKIPQNYATAIRDLAKDKNGDDGQSFGQ